MVNENKIRVASVAWKVRKISSDADFFSHLRELVENAVKQNAKLIVLPELFEVELVTMLPDGPENRVPEILLPYASKIEEEFSALARRHNVTIVGGSHLVERAEGILNVSGTYTPDGRIFLQPKNCLTRWESETWKIQSKQGVTEMPDSRVGVLICYDSEFPESGRALSEAGVQLLCVPTYTAGQHGYQRVEWCCRARSVENEIFVALSTLVGPIISFDLGTAYGSSSIMCPSKTPFPNNATLASTPLNEEGIAVADVDFDALGECRATGDARPWSDRNLSHWNHS